MPEILVGASMFAEPGESITSACNSINCEVQQLVIGGQQEVLEGYIERYQKVVEMTEKYRDLLQADLERIFQIVTFFEREEAVLLTK